MANLIHSSDWFPGTPRVSNNDLQSSSVLVMHYWAVWNLHDREMDQRIAVLRNEYADRICFRSCDVDCAENQSFIHGIANVPALGCFIQGKWVNSQVGLRSKNELRHLLDALLAANENRG